MLGDPLENRFVSSVNVYRMKTVDSGGGTIPDTSFKYLNSVVHADVSNNPTTITSLVVTQLCFTEDTVGDVRLVVAAGSVKGSLGEDTAHPTSTKFRIGDTSTKQDFPVGM